MSKKKQRPYMTELGRRMLVDSGAIAEDDKRTGVELHRDFMAPHLCKGVCPDCGKQLYHEKEGHHCPNCGDYKKKSIGCEYD